MKEKRILMIPGPAMVPPRVFRAMSVAQVGHRTPFFSDVLKEVSENLAMVFMTENPVFVLTSSGTGAMEAAVMNFINPGEKVLVAVNGKFGGRFAELNRRAGAEVLELQYGAGRPAEPSEIGEILAGDTEKEIKAVFVQQSETSTGVLNNLREIREAMGNHPALFIVDAVSGMVAGELKMDEMGIDVAVSGSQKAFMVPPGLAFLSASPRALEKAENKKGPAYYFDITAAYKSFLKDTTPYTPATSLVLGLQESLKMLLEEGMENVWARHRLFSRITRESLKAMGIKLLVEEERFSSPAVTSAFVPEGIDWKKVTSVLEETYEIQFAGGQDELKGVIFRIGHLGYLNLTEMLAVIASFELALEEAGFRCRGRGIAKAQEIILESRK